MTAQSMPYEPEQLETVAEVEVDSRGRVSLGKAGAEPGRCYRVDGGSIQTRTDSVRFKLRFAAHTPGPQSRSQAGVRRWIEHVDPVLGAVLGVLGITGRTP